MIGDEDGRGAASSIQQRIRIICEFLCSICWSYWGHYHPPGSAATTGDIALHSLLNSESSGGSTTASSEEDGPTVSDMEVREWDKDNNKAMGAIKLHISSDIHQDIKGLTTARKMWRQLARDFGKASTSAVYNDFKRLLNVSIPPNAHPGPALDKIFVLFKKMEEATEGEVKIPTFLKTMVLFLKLPDPFANLVQKETMDTINNLGQTNFKNLKSAIISIWAGKDTRTSRPYANCLIANK
ncbi:hypothetical protein D9758_004919 [Tetrapyrgos nigripes]|uniref:Uncharacterized protein n=1 Tax=Tetrapyrgos nigripes TaxID=182062 RepID=A0A8H5GWC5_9AGAR|nr:hypothetical protein D9758_004919 [Tetrapyrgos nigripes]